MQYRQLPGWSNAEIPSLRHLRSHASPFLEGTGNSWSFSYLQVCEPDAQAMARRLPLKSGWLYASPRPPTVFVERWWTMRWIQ